jgi:hypothetical protein
MKDKWQVLHGFWAGFMLPAYDASSVPDNATMPYITYSGVVAPFENVVLLSGDIWYRSTSWAEISKKADEIGASLERYSMLRINEDEFLMLTQGTPFAQRMADENDAVKRIHVNVMGEYFTFY